MHASNSPLTVALLGAGTVGTEVARILTEQAESLAARSGRRLELIGIAVRDLDTPRGTGIDRSLLTADATSLVSRADIVVEVMGGIRPAKDLLLQAIRSGASVITANKALLAAEGTDLYEAADAAGVDIYFEAAVAGGIPLVRPIRESLAGDNITRILGILNGTTNYVLDAMTSTGASFDDALATAKELGYAEADPTADVEGLDAAAKAAILASLAFHSRVRGDDVYTKGIRGITTDDIAAATDLDHVIKLLAVIEHVDGGISARVFPAMLPTSHPLANVREAYNAVFVEAEAAGRLMFYGAGAGGSPTASAVMGDVISAARNRVAGGHSPAESAYAALERIPHQRIRGAYYLSVEVPDRSGVLADIAGVFGGHDVSIAVLRQSPLPEDETPGAETSSDRALLRIVTHRCLEEDMVTTLEELGGSGSDVAVRSVLRVEGD